MSNHAKNQSVTQITQNQSIRTPEGDSITLISDGRVKRTAILIAKTLFPSYFDSSRYGRSMYADRRQYGVRYKTVRNGFHSTGQDVCDTLNEYYKCNNIHAVAYRWGRYNSICIAVKEPWQSTERFYKQFPFAAPAAAPAKKQPIAKVSDNPAIAILKKHIDTYKGELKDIQSAMTSSRLYNDFDHLAALAKDGVEMQARIDALETALEVIEDKVLRQVNDKNIYGNFAKHKKAERTWDESNDEALSPYSY